MTTPNQLHELTERFIHHMQVRNFASSTIALRRKYLVRFTDWCHERGIDNVHDITRTVLQSYQRHVFHYRNAKTGRPLKFSTQISLLGPIRAWFRYLRRENQIETNPAADLDFPKEEQRLPETILSPSQIETIMNQPKIETPLGLRDRAMLEVLYSTAMRRSELIDLDIYDINYEAGTVTIRQGKGGKDRVVPIGVRALSWLTKYTEDARGDFAAHTNTTGLFVSFRGRRFCPPNLSILIRDYIKAAGITRPGSCHLFRHAAATQMLENGADIRSLQQLLGHAELTSTQIYTHISIKHLKDVHRTTHPADLPRQTDETNDSPPDDIDGETN